MDEKPTVETISDDETSEVDESTNAELQQLKSKIPRKEKPLVPQRTDV